MHGAGGGYDQGLFIGENYVGDGHHFIAPSRFGYVRSSIPQNGSPAAQADAYAALLDSLGVERVAVVGFSDGGPSALPRDDRLDVLDHEAELVVGTGRGSIQAQKQAPAWRACRRFHVR